MQVIETSGVGSGMIMSFALDLAIETDLSNMNWKGMPRVSDKGGNRKGSGISHSWIVIIPHRSFPY